MAIDFKNKKYIGIGKLVGIILIDWICVYIINRIKSEIYHRSKKWLLFICSTTIFVIDLLKQFIKRNIRNWKPFFYDANQAFLGLFLSHIFSNFFSDFIKFFAGRYRPSFLTVCDVDFDKVKEQFLHFQNVIGGDKKLIVEEQKSFPSGHTALAFATLTFLTLYLAGQLRLYHGKCRVWKYGIVSAPLFFAFYVPFSRLMDYRHHWEDVLVGGLIGMFFAITLYYFIYPPLRDQDCDTPTNSYKETKSKKVKVDDDEEEIVEEQPITTDKKTVQIV
ncbi:hypothetical protein PIROE2DRAFT_8063 [Piromyces sp. E2]|nr:hypothetical protein PIROE2DRAFT_8063 [Piromyces sp. E2]|eukprot:OUM65000.1 hypothetical protein PIROE2DRAFT_8063 [Piromyces sp. E2]